ARARRRGRRRHPRRLRRYLRRGTGGLRGTPARAEPRRSLAARALPKAARGLQSARGDRGRRHRAEEREWQDRPRGARGAVAAADAPLMDTPRFGLSLPNRGVLFGATSVDELLALSETAEASGLFDSVWVGDSLFAKPRLESLVLLSAIAPRTRRVRLGTCCLSTFPLRDPIFLAAQWAALDQVSNGR